MIQLSTTSVLPGKTMPQISSLTLTFCPMLNVTCIHFSKYHLKLLYETKGNYFLIGWKNDGRFEEKWHKSKQNIQKKLKSIYPNPPQTTKQSISVAFFPPVTSITCSCSGWSNLVMFLAQLLSHMGLRKNTCILQCLAKLKDSERFVHFHYERRSTSSNSSAEHPKL